MSGGSSEEDDGKILLPGATKPHNTLPTYDRMSGVGLGDYEPIWQIVKGETGDYFITGNSFEIVKNMLYPYGLILEPKIGFVRTMGWAIYKVTQRPNLKTGVKEHKVLKFFDRNRALAMGIELEEEKEKNEEKLPSLRTAADLKVEEDINQIKKDVAELQTITRLYKDSIEQLVRSFFMLSAVMQKTANYFNKSFESLGYKFQEKVEGDSSHVDSDD